MDSNANYSLIGIVSAAVGGLVLAFVYWFVVADASSERVPYDIVFTGTVTGLSTGTAVLFNGIPVGQVDDVAIDPQDPGKVIARIQVEPEAPVKTDTKALLEFQGLTGVGYVQLSGGSPEAPRLIPEEGRRVARMLAEKSDFQSIVDGVRDTIAGASSSFERLEAFLNDNEGSVSATLANMEQFTNALGQNADGIDLFLATLADAGAEIGPLAVELKQLSSDVRGLIGDVEPGQIAKIVEDFSEFSGTLSGSSGLVSSILTSVDTTATTLKGYADDLQPAIADAIEVAAAIDPEAVSSVVGNAREFSVVLSKNSATVDDFLSDVGTVGERLEAASRRIEAIVANVDAMTAEGGDTGLFDDLSDAAKAIETLALNLDARTASIATGANGGLSQFGSIAVDIQAVVARLDSILRNIERNPQSVVFGGGGGSVRDYNKE